MSKAKLIELATMSTFNFIDWIRDRNRTVGEIQNIFIQALKDQHNDTLTGCIDDVEDTGGCHLYRDKGLEEL